MKTNMRRLGSGICVAVSMFFYAMPLSAALCLDGEEYDCYCIKYRMVTEPSYYSCSTGGTCSGSTDASCGKNVSTNHPAWTDPFTDSNGSGVYEIEACTTTSWQAGTCTFVPATSYEGCCEIATCNPCYLVDMCGD